MANHLKFVARTVMVQNGNIDSAYKALNRILTVDGIVEKAMRSRYYEKPCIRKRRIKFETCKRIYNSEMNRKIAFLSQKTREDPWPGC